MKNLFSLILALALCTAAALGYGALVYMLDGYVGRIETAVAGAETLNQRDSEARAIGRFLTDTALEREALAATVVTEADVVGVIETVEAVARLARVQLSISSVAVVPIGTWSQHEAVELTFSASGSFVALQDFVASLETLPLISHLDSVSLEASSGSGWFGTFRMIFAKEKP
jgi:hypothetical protein